MITHDTLMALPEPSNLGMDSYGFDIKGYDAEDVQQIISAAIAEVVAERDQLKQAINEELPTLEALNKRFGEVVAERDALAKDAARYQWLREQHCVGILETTLDIESARHPQFELDAAIDSAMKGTPT